MGEIIDEKSVVEGLEMNVKNLQAELDMYPIKLKHNKTLLSRGERRVELHKRMHDALIDNLRIIEPKFEFETKDAFWETKRGLQELEHEITIDKFETENDALREGIKHIEKELKRIEKELPIAEAELKEAKGE